MTELFDMLALVLKEITYRIAVIMANYMCGASPHGWDKELKDRFMEEIIDIELLVISMLSYSSLML